MVEYNSERVRSAVQYLVDTPYFPHRVKGIRTAVLKPRSMPFKDDAECLNELLVVGRQSLQALENLIAVAERKRDTRTDYQREFMRAKRERERFVIELNQLDRSTSIGREERYRILQRWHADQERERNMFVEARCNKHRVDTGEEASSEDKSRFIKEFWAKVDMDLRRQVDMSRAAKNRRSKVRVVHNQSIAEAFARTLKK